MITFTQYDLSITLRAIYFNQPLPTTPLFQLRSIPYTMYDSMSSDLAMTDWLVSLICQQLNNQRDIHKLPFLTSKTNKDTTEIEIQKAYTLNAVYLQAWTLLYARVVRVDLNLTMTQLGAVTSTHPRTLRRRQQLGIYCLYAHINRLERNHR